MDRRKALTLLAATTAAMTMNDDALAFAAAATGVSSPYAVDDAALFGALDYAANPALAPVQKAWGTGDAAGARKALAAYLRARTSVPWTVSPKVSDRAAVKWDEKKAARALAGDVTVVTVPHRFPDGQIDWHFNATGGATGLPNNNEWVWQLNRMEWWWDLIRAYQATGDEKYAKVWVAQMRSWRDQCPPPAKVANGVGSAWRTIECGIRGNGILPSVYHAFLLSPSVSDDDLIAFVRTIVEHGVYLSQNYTHGNWLTMEMNGLYAVGALFPELKKAAAWRKQAGDALYHEMSVQFLPDGAQYELTPGYHNVALRNVLGLYQTAVRTGHEGELPADYTAGMERAFAYDLWLMTPDRSLPRFNDSWPDGVPSMLGIGARLFPKRADFVWVATGGKEGKPPEETSHAFPYAGYYVMRDGWGTDACYAAFDAGPLGNGHYHQDKLNLVVWAYGRELLYDSGGGSYETSRYRAYATDTFGHNTVLVDGKPQRRDGKNPAERVVKAPIDAGWETAAPGFVRVEGVYDEGYGEVGAKIATHRRRVAFSPAIAPVPPLWVVADTLTPADGAPHTYQARWNLLTTLSATDPKTGITVTTDPGQPNLAVVPLRTDGLTVKSVSAQTEPEILGWNVRKDMDPQYVPATTVCHTVTGPGERTFLTLLLPLKPGAPANPVTSVTPLGDGRIEIALATGPRLLVKVDTAGITVGVEAIGGAA